MRKRRKTYKKLALKNHPDKNNESEASRDEAQKRFLEVQKAYDVLSDAAAKRTYDATQRRSRPGSARSAGFSKGFDDDLFQAFARNNAWRRR